MALKVLKGVVCLAIGIAVVASTVTTPAWAQAGSNEAKPSSGGPRKQLATILYAGLGGAVLGLSTLSFYGRPQDKLANIAIGFAVGVMAGTAYVTYSAATNPDDFYGNSASIGHSDWRRDSMSLAMATNARQRPDDQDGLSLGYTFEF